MTHPGRIIECMGLPRRPRPQQSGSCLIVRDRNDTALRIFMPSTSATEETYGRNTTLQSTLACE